MDSYEATRVVYSRIQSFDPENASKIMGLLLIQDHGEKEMIRLAFGPETLVHSVILKARKDLGLSSANVSPSSTPSSPSPFCSNPIAISRQNSLASRLSMITVASNPSPHHDQQQSSPEDNNGLFLSSNTTTASSSSSNSSTSLSSSSLPFYQNGSSYGPAENLNAMDEFQLQDQLSFLNENLSSSSSPPKNHNHHHHHPADLFFPGQQDLLLSSSPTNDMYWPTSPSSSAMAHRRSCSVSDMCMAAEDPSSGFGWKPCLYFARGYCKNGASCRFLHGDDSVIPQQQPQVVVGVVGSPSSNNKLDAAAAAMIEQHHQCHHNHSNNHHHHELLRSKSVQQQRLVSASHQLMANSFPYSPKCMNLLLQHQQNESQRAAATALMMGSEDLHKFGRTRLERNEFAMNGCVNPASRQIYLTFPADSTFREEDVSNYFSIYGPVQDVRIPYQQKRMFGFVTFVYPETVKLILAKGNPHFVCDARVLVKPYKEKGKVQDKYRKQQQQQQQQQAQVERGDFSPCGTPTGLESRDPFDLQLGARMFYNSQDMLWRRKLEEQAEFQQALELQSRRLMGLQLLDVKKHHHRALSAGSPIHSPPTTTASAAHSPNFFTAQNLVLSSIHNTSEIPLDHNCLTPNSVIPLDHPLPAVSSRKESPAASHDEDGNDKDCSDHDEIGDLLESLEHNLPDSPFASPMKAGEANYNDHMNAFSGQNVVVSSNDHIIHSSSSLLSSSSSSDLSSSNSTNINSLSTTTTTTTLIPSSTLDMASFKSFNCQLPRFSSGHGAIGMYAGTAGGPKYPVGI